PAIGSKTATVRNEHFRFAVRSGNGCQAKLSRGRDIILISHPSDLSHEHKPFAVGPETVTPAPFTTTAGGFQPSTGANTDTSPSLVTASRSSRGNQTASAPSKDAPDCPSLRATDSLSWRLRYASQRPDDENRGECNPSPETILTARPSGNSRVQRLPAPTHVNVPSAV